MEFKKLAEKRYSCRKLSDEKVEKEKLEHILETARLAPTAVNYQPYQIFVMESEEAKKSVKKATGYTFGANTFLMVGYHEEDGWVREFDKHNFAGVDASIVATHIMLSIYDQGLATTWVGHFDSEVLKDNHAEMRGYELIALFPIGYEAKDAKPAKLHFKRKTKEELVTIL